MVKKENNIADLENNHEALKQKAKEMFADLELDEDFQEEEKDDKKQFSATQLINFNNQANINSQ